MNAAARIERYKGAAASARRVRAVLRRHGYLILKSWTRIASMMYYPTVTMVVWGFLTLYLAPTNNFLRDAPGFFIGAVLLWDLLFRGQLGVSLTFIEEFYARNLGNLFVSPLTLPEYIAGQLVMSMLRAGVVVDQGSPRDLIARYGRENMEEVFLDIARGRIEERVPGSAAEEGGA